MSRTHASSIIPPPCSYVFLSRLKLRINIHKGGVIFHPKRERTKTLNALNPPPKNFNKLLRIIDTHGPQAIPGTSYSCIPMHIQISADGETGTLIFCVKNSMLLSQHETKIISQNNKHIIHRINTNLYHENVDSSSTGSTHVMLLLCLNISF